MPTANDAGMGGLATRWRRRKQTAAAPAINDAAEPEETITFAEDDDLQAQLQDTYADDDGYVQVDRDTAAAAMISQHTQQEAATTDNTAAAATAEAT